MTTQLINQEIETAKSAQKSINTMNVDETKVGDFYCASWGYDQTNIDFYQVISITPKGLKLRKVESKKEFTGDYTHGGYATPIKDKFKGDPFQRRLLWNSPTVRIEHRTCAYLWNGTPERFTNWG